MSNILTNDPTIKNFYTVTTATPCHSEFGVIHPDFCPMGGWHHATVKDGFAREEDAQLFADSLNKERLEKLNAVSNGDELSEKVIKCHE